MKNPIQPLNIDKHGTLRFKKNEIVDYILENGGIDLNHIAGMKFSNDDREQFAQLIGYSLSGFGDLSYVSSDTYNIADKSFHENCSIMEAENKILREQLDLVKNALRSLMPNIFNIHPDDAEALL